MSTAAPRPAPGPGERRRRTRRRPRTVIDFRYHIVSLISVFLALAVGIALGAGPLKETIGDTLTGQVEQLPRREGRAPRRARHHVGRARRTPRPTSTPPVPQLLDGTLTGPPRRRRSRSVRSTRRSAPRSTTRLTQSGATRHGPRHVDGHVDRPGRAHVPPGARRPAAHVPRPGAGRRRGRRGRARLGAGAGPRHVGPEQPGRAVRRRRPCCSSSSVERERQPLVTVADQVTVPADAIVVIGVPREEAAADATPSPAPSESTVVAPARDPQRRAGALDGRRPGRRPARRGQRSRTPCSPTSDLAATLTTVSGTAVVTGQVNVPLALAGRIAGTNGHYGFGDERDRRCRGRRAARRSTARRGCPRVRTSTAGTERMTVGVAASRPRGRRRERGRPRSCRGAFDDQAPGGQARWTRTNHRGEPVSLLEGPRSPRDCSPADSSARRPPRGAVALDGRDRVRRGLRPRRRPRRGHRDAPKGLRGHLGALARGQRHHRRAQGARHRRRRARRGRGRDAGAPDGRHAALDGRLGPTSSPPERCRRRPPTSSTCSTCVPAGRSRRPGSRRPRSRSPGGGAGAGAAVLGAVGAAMDQDLAESDMLGDGGANALGACSAPRSSRAPRGRSVRGARRVVGLTLASEKVSFTRVIARTPCCASSTRWGGGPATRPVGPAA